MLRRHTEMLRAKFSATLARRQPRTKRLLSEPLECRMLLSATTIAGTPNEVDDGLYAPEVACASAFLPECSDANHVHAVSTESMIYVPEGQEPTLVPEPRFVQAGSKWSQPGGLGTPVTITYSYSNLLDAGLPGGLSPNDLRAATEEALAEWAAYAPLNFIELVDSGPAPSDANYSATNRPMLRFGHHFIDGSSGQNTLAHAYIPGGSGLSGDIHFDNGNTWGLRPSGGVIDLLEVMTHELGHALGLDHEDDVSAIMNSIYARRYNGLGTAFLFQDDINGIRAVYGAGVGSVTPLAGDDNYELNNSLATAADPLGNSGNWNQRLLSSISGLAVQSDHDWYEISVTEDFQRVQVDAFFSHGSGNIDIALFDAAGNLLVESASNSDDEHLEYVVSTPGSYFVRVDGDNAGNTYDLTWNRLFSLTLVDSIVSASTADTSVYEFTVAFNREVAGVDSTDFALTTTGTVTGNITAVSEIAGDSYVVTVSDVAGQGILQLELIDDDSIFGNLPAAATFDGYDTQLSLVVNPAGTFQLLAEVDPAVGGGLSGFNIDLINIDSAVNLAPRLAVGGLPQRGFTVGLQDLSGDGSLFSEQNLVNQESLIFGIGQTAGGSVPEGFTGINVPWGSPVTLATGTWSAARPTLGESTTATLFNSVGTASAIDAIENTRIANVTPLGGLGLEDGNAQSDVVDLSPPPSVVSITGATTGNPSIVEFTVLFTEDVRGVDLTDFTLATTGTAVATLSGVTKIAGDTYLVRAENVSGAGTLRLDLTDDDSIVGRLPLPATFAGFDTQLSLLVNPAGTFELVAQVEPGFSGGLSGYNVGLVNIDSAMNLAPRLFGGSGVQGFTIGLANLTGDGALFAGQNLLNSASLIYGIGQGASGTVPDGFIGINVPWDNPLTLATGTFSGATPALGTSQNATLFSSVGATTAVAAIVDGRLAEVTALGGQGLINGDFAGEVLPLALPGDFDVDGDVDGEDFLRWQAGFGITTGATLGDGDANGDGAVDGGDFLIWQANFGILPPAGSGAQAESRLRAVEIGDRARDEALSTLTDHTPFSRRRLIRGASLRTGADLQGDDQLAAQAPRFLRPAQRLAGL